MVHGPEAEPLIQADTWRMDCLEVVKKADLPDWLIVAGFVRNLIWDHLHGRNVSTPLNDVDVVFFDATDFSTATEQRIEESLKKIRPGIRWEVRNQARMHLRNGHRPYECTADAISYYPELQTCIGARIIGDGDVEVVAPHGVEHNWTYTITMNPKANYPRSVVLNRVIDKRWLETWPALRMEGPNDV
jgi:hypothetical protein